MAEILITFPDGKIKSYPQGISAKEILLEIGGRISREAVAIKFNDQVLDLSTTLSHDGALVFLTTDSADGMHVFWHSAAHVMAHAVKSIFPRAKFAFGPPLDDGFYYDVDIARALTPEDLESIEKKMTEIVQADQPFVRRDLSKDEALKLFQNLNETYKVEQIQRLGEPPSIYQQGDFIDLCRGPHLPSAGYVKHFKLLSVAGAYWLADEKNPMLQRIYGVAFPKKSQLEEYLFRLEEAKKRDHRRLGKELDLYSINDELGAGLILWHPKGAFIRYKIEEFWKEEHLKAGYEFVNTPHIARANLWSTSGHLDFFHENMFAPMIVDEQQYLIKPMNCPFHLLIYKITVRSYRDLPLRWAELGTVYRYERSGVLHGLLRVRGFTQDDAHLICRPDQLDAEISRVLDFCLYMLRSFGFTEYDVFLSTRPAHFVGTVENWETATQALKNALERGQVAYQVDPGEGVFYGPKIDIKIKDLLGRTWQCSTIQVDFNEPERFNITYVGQDGNRHRPIMVHRALLGSMERFFGVMIEHYAGAFPLWLAPVQAVVIPISEKQHEYARTILAMLQEGGVRATFDERNEKIGYKIRDAETQKIPYMLILGQKEVDTQTISLRKHKEGDCGIVTVQSVIDEIKEKVRSKQSL